MDCIFTIATEEVTKIFTIVYCEGVVSFACVNSFLAFGSIDGVVPASWVVEIASYAPVNDIIAGTRVNIVSSGSAKDVVITRSNRDNIGAVTSIDRIVT